MSSRAKSIDTVERFYRALMAGEDVGSFFDDESFWLVPGGTEISGEFKGREAIASLFARMREIAQGTFRSAAADLVDIMASEHHCVLLDRFVAERSDGRKLNSYQIWLFHVSGDTLGNCFFYLEDPDGFDAFWS